VKPAASLISCSHWPPDGSLSVLVGRHRAMKPAGKVRCNMANQIRLANHNCNFCRLKARVLLPSTSGHDALRLRRGKPRPAAKTSPRRVGALNVICALPEEKPRLWDRGSVGDTLKRDIRKREKCLTCDHRGFGAH